MSGHRTVVATGPGAMRRLCCGGAPVDREVSEILHAALEAIDDHVALVDGSPVAVDSLRPSALRSLDCVNPQGHRAFRIVHPSWWPSSRLDVVTAAAGSLSDDVEVRPRSWLLRQASNARPESVVVEIAERLVAIVSDGVVAVARSAEPPAVAEEVARHVGEMVCGATTTVLIDMPDSIAGAPALATLIAGSLRQRGQRTMRIDDARLSRLARAATVKPGVRMPQPQNAGRRSRARVFGGLVAAAAVLAATVSAIATGGQRPIAPVAAAQTTFLVEGRVALTVPANWPTQRVIVGPGSARVQVTSPSDPEAALHITQSRIPGETLSVTADRLKHAIDSEPAGVFVDFNPAGFIAGRAAVTYREVRDTHQVRWAVLVDGSVRIAVGCQSRPGGEDAVRGACEEAVRSAHAIG
ncbi:type VII secretion-associated protein [Mycobacterium genavense]|uniref:type VII secretion-associated protein n=1 Tax=Mycobacterium genavense TaxID=36812 RepID=UPI000470D9BC|nr:type VII secretion-associated protein [Mycobacterium genavense]